MYTNDDTDQWGRDPQVRTMRRIFARIEVLQSALLEKIGISPFDDRLGHWRQAALRAFEQEWAEVAGRGRPLAEEDIARVYVDCLIRILKKGGIGLSDEALQTVMS
jgi:hypothetical protein